MVATFYNIVNQIIAYTGNIIYYAELGGIIFVSQ